MTRLTDWLENFSYSVNGRMTCQKCFEVVDRGTYYPEKKQVVFVCSGGHENRVPYE